jgi:hypothetical protein
MSSLGLNLRAVTGAPMLHSRQIPRQVECDMHDLGAFGRQPCTTAELAANAARNQ